MVIQFHATHDDLLRFVLEMIKNDWEIGGIILFPEFNIKCVTKNLNASDINDFDMIIISKQPIQIADSYEDFIKNQDNNLGITVGKEKGDKLFETSMWIYTELEIDPDWKKMINLIKKRMNRGAWVINPYNKNRKFDKNHMYTDDAKTAYKKGVKICPIAGWNIYELTNENS